MQTRTAWLLLALGGALVLLIRYRRNGQTQTLAVDALEEVVASVQKIAALPRGLRNHNPGNLIYLSRNAYRGQVGRDPDGFGIYVDDAHGVRALAKELQNDYGRKGLNTVRKLITEWAPPSENDTEAYVRAVSKALGVGADAVIDVPARLPELAAAIIRQENGQQPFSAAQLQEWVYLA